MALLAVATCTILDGWTQSPSINIDFVYVYYVVVSKQTIIYMYSNLGICNKFSQMMFCLMFNMHGVLFQHLKFLMVSQGYGHSQLVKLN